MFAHGYEFAYFCPQIFVVFFFKVSDFFQPNSCSGFLPFFKHDKKGRRKLAPLVSKKAEELSPEAIDAALSLSFDSSHELLDLVVTLFTVFTIRNFGQIIHHDLQ